MEAMERGDSNVSAVAMREHIMHTAKLLIAQEAGIPSAIDDINLDWTA